MVLSTTKHATRAPVLLLLNKLAIEANIDILGGAENRYGADTDTDTELINGAIKNPGCEQSAKLGYQ